MAVFVGSADGRPVNIGKAWLLEQGFGQFHAAAHGVIAVNDGKVNVGTAARQLGGFKFYDLDVFWTVTEVFYRNLHKKRGDEIQFSKRVSSLLSRIDMSTILFFLGILMAVACLEEVGVLKELGSGLNITFNGNHYAVTGIIGVLSAIVDNVPLVAGSMGMYPIGIEPDMAVDGIFWQLLAYCAGVGGSMLIVGSAAGVVVMGLEKITFGWYMKRITWIAFLGYIAGILSYWIMRTYIFTTPL